MQIYSSLWVIDVFKFNSVQIDSVLLISSGIFAEFKILLTGLKMMFGYGTWEL